jgi:L-ascorbate metabolism protein UlaG (beta-lactamase superfamily)
LTVGNASGALAISQALAVLAVVPFRSADSTHYLYKELLREHRMEISWLGHSCFGLRGKSAVLVTDPFLPQQTDSTGANPKLTTLPTSIVTLSQRHSQKDYLAGITGKPHVVYGPGEYEISDVLITGVASSFNGSDETRIPIAQQNTIYVIHMDELVICHLGHLTRSLQQEQLEEAADADILLVPIGGNETLGATQAAEVVSQVEPRIIIPMLYQWPEGEVPAELTRFCGEMGVESINPQPKFSVTKSSLPTTTQVVLLSPRYKS